MISKTMQETTTASPPLPIIEYREVIEETIEKNIVTLVTAETGAGKSSRVPLWLWGKGKRVHVTQPRRIAARSLSHYVAQLTSTHLGMEIGYQTGFDSRKCRDTKLLYVTDGVQMIQEIKGKRDYDVLILDEVHEWNLNQEVLIGIVKKNLDINHYQKNDKRVVVMSATLQAEKLSAFLDGAPIISVPGRGYPVTIHHNHPYLILPDTAQMVELGQNVLVFQPGKSEIDEFMESLKRMLEAEKIKARILPLHAELSLKDQARVFEHFAVPKVIVATDIAQTSLTIDDIDAVVDCGIKKEVRVVKGIEGLYPVDISSAECMQRAGRAGRVKTGQYFLCADGGIQDRLPFPEPEIRRLNLECVVLRLIKWGIPPLDFPFFHSPQKSLIYKAIKKLKVFGAITEDEKVTPEGSQMAEFPVSLRSAKLLLEARKGGPKVVDSSIKLIAILETRGIVSKEYIGGKYTNAPYNSELLNQLALWESARTNRQVISQKKFALAQDIYRELKKRMELPFLRVPAKLISREIKMLYRAVLSSFVDEIHIRCGANYQRDNEERQLDRTSVLFSSQPEIIVGLPFDLIINRENMATGEKEEKIIPLVTFASEINASILDELEPYSYHKHEEIKIQNNRIKVLREFSFGGKLIKSMETPPDMHNSAEKERVVQAALRWYEENQEKFEILKQQENLAQHFNEIKKIVKGKLKSFDFYWQGFLCRELKDHLKIDDLDMFFRFHKGFSHITLKKLVPFHFIRELKWVRWPAELKINGEKIKILYLQKKPFIKFDYPAFEKIKETDTILPTGERAGIILGRRKFWHWELAVHEFNNWKRVNIFEKRLKNSKQPGNIEDMMEISFPQTLSGAMGKDNIALEYYCVPEIEGEDLFIKYFLDEDQARIYFEAHQAQWEQFIKDYKRKKLENIFRKKGWKVKP